MPEREQAPGLSPLVTKLMKRICYYPRRGSFYSLRCTVVIVVVVRMAQAQTLALGQEQLAQLEEREVALRQIEVFYL